MEDVNGMSDQEKSAALLRLMGQAVDCTCGKPGCTVGREIDSGRGWFVPTVKNLYDPANMALSVKVMLWAFETVLQDNSDEYRWLFAYNFLKDTRTALNNVLKLAIAAGMVTE